MEFKLFINFIYNILKIIFFAIKNFFLTFIRFKKDQLEERNDFTYIWKNGKIAKDLYYVVEK